MKYFKRLKIYKAQNVTFNPNPLKAYSYNWWNFVSIIEGKVIFNDFNYSNSTRRHQWKVKRLMESLGIEIDQVVWTPKSLSEFDTLEALYLNVEEHLCNEYLEGELKKQERNERAKYRRHAKKLEEYLENEAHFRDYEIKERRLFGKLNTIAVHQCVDLESLERDVQNALHSFHRDGFGKVVFYVGGAK